MICISSDIFIFCFDVVLCIDVILVDCEIVMFEKMICFFFRIIIIMMMVVKRNCLYLVCYYSIKIIGY